VGEKQATAASTGALRPVGRHRPETELYLAIWQDSTDDADDDQHYRVRRLTDEGAGKPLAGWLLFEKVDI
jgi:hypothetical protein